MKKNKLYLFASTVGVLGLMTAGCSNNSQNSAKNDNVTQTHQSSDTQSNSTEPKVAKISDKALAVIAFDMSRPYTSMEDLDATIANTSVYGTNYQGKMPTDNISKSDAAKIRGAHYVNSVDNDSRSDVWFKRNGDKLYVTIYNTDLEEPEVVTHTYSINKLVKERYHTAQQKEKIDKYANNLKDAKQKKEEANKPTDISKLDDKTIGVLAYLTAHDGYMGGSYYYGAHYKKGNPKIRGQHFIDRDNGASDPVWFKCDGDRIEISKLEMGYEPEREDADIKTTTYSLKEIVKKYYDTAKQRNEIDDKVKSLDSEKRSNNSRLSVKGTISMMEVCLLLVGKITYL